MPRETSDFRSGTRRRLGLIVNPVAGLGGRVALKGSDGAKTQQEALARGAIPLAGERTRQTLEQLVRLKDRIDLFTYSCEMGERAARESGFEPTVLGSIRAGETTAADTRRAAQEMESLQVDLLLFSGGDGTARDIHDAVGERVVVLGIPAGVKMHSAAFAVSPVAAGDLARDYLAGRSRGLRAAEVMDVDEEGLRRGTLSTRLYGCLRVPEDARLLQGRKAPTPTSEAATLAAIAEEVVERMDEGTLYLVGPGSTTRSVLSRLGLPKTLLGIDVVSGRRLVAADADEARLLDLLDDRAATIVVSPIGGQGHLFGRGNQPLSPRVLRAVGKENILVVAAPDKIHALHGRPLLVDTGEPQLDRELSGYVSVVTGYREEAIYPVSGEGD